MSLTLGASALPMLSGRLFRAKESVKSNILFLAVDDLRPQLGCYGHTKMISPNIDRIAEMGTTFARAYCNVPVCGASRASLLTGLYPTRSRFTEAHSKAQTDAPDAMSMQTHFKSNGYHTISNGKIYQHVTDYVDGWSEKPWRPNGDWWGWQAYLAEESKEVIRQQIARGNGAPGPFYKVENEPGKYHALPGLGLVKSGPAYEAPDVADNDYPDGMLADKVILDLQNLKDQSEPFFLAAGFVKPHLPFAAPKKYWDFYDRNQIDLADNPFRPQGAPDEALHNWPELRSYAGIPAQGPLDDELARTLIHGYYACVSYTDAQIGRILDELERLDLAKNTIIVLWGDHGWNLGEHGLWCKHATFETSLHSPLLVSSPEYQGGQVSNALTEFVDIYPTLCELAGLDVPAGLHGKSLVPLMQNPDQEWKQMVYSRYKNGESIKTDHYRYTEYYDDNGNMTSRMLYDHRTDPHENVNIVERPENKNLVSELTQKLGTYIRN